MIMCYLDKRDKGISDMARKKATTNSRARLLKVPVTLYLEPEQAAELKILTDRTRVPQQEYIREGVDLLLAKYRRKP